MIANTDLRGMAHEYLHAAKLPRTRRSYDVAVYLCGYAMEIALKARICRTLRWAGFPSTGGEFQHVKSVQTHLFEALILFSGVEARVKPALASDWSVVKKWAPEQRYSPVGTQTAADAAEMIAATATLLKVLL